jgi:hypothetical protein
MRRRDVIVGSGTVAAVTLSGSASAVTGTADDDRTTPSSDLESVLELVPAESALDAQYRRLQYARVDDSGEDDPGYQTRRVLEDIAEVDGGIDSDSVSAVVSVHGKQQRLSAAVGSFDRPDAGSDAEERGEWRIADLGSGGAFAAADGRLVVVPDAETDPADVAGVAADAASGDADTVLVDPEATEPVFGHLESAAYVVFFPDLESIGYFEFDERIASLGVGLEQSPPQRSGTTETEYVVEVASDAEVADEWIVDRLERLERGEFVETTVERDEGFVHVEAVVDRPPERDRDAAPDARVRARSNADEGLVTFEHDGGASIDAEMLEVWVDGELADAQLADEYGTFSEGDTFELETGPIADVGLRWFDESDDVYYYYATTLVGADSFEASHDPETDTVTITYVGELEADPDRLEVVHRKSQPDGRGSTIDTERSALEDVSGSLAQGDTVTVEDVTVGDRVSLESTAPANPNRGQRSLAHVHVRPPRFHLTRQEDTLVAHYWGELEHDADDFRVSIDGEPADVQFADVTETVSRNDEIELGELSHGSRVAVEWLVPDDPVVVEETVLHPHARVEVTYDDAEGSAAVEYREGDEIAADDLDSLVGGEPAPDQPADEYETFSPGDEVRTEAAPFETIELVWTGPEETEDVLGRTVAGRELLDASYDPDAETVELVYTGETPADPSPLSVQHRSDGGSPSDGRENPFSQKYDTLTAGDGVVIEDVGVEDHVSVMLVREGDGHVSHRSLFHFSPIPHRAFDFENRDDGLVAVYHGQLDRDADAFRLLVDGEPADVQPADRHDTLTTGDEVELGAYETGTELTMEWVVPDEPRPVNDHVVVPDAEFEVAYDSDDGTVTVEHAGGDEIAAADLGVIVEPTSREPSGWDEYETVSEGDATTIAVDGERDGDPVAVVIIFDGRAITHERIDD